MPLDNGSLKRQVTPSLPASLGGGVTGGGHGSWQIQSQLAASDASPTLNKQRNKTKQNTRVKS